MADQDSQTEDRINLRAVGYAVRFQSSVSVVGAVEEETDAEIQIRCATKPPTKTTNKTANTHSLKNESLARIPEMMTGPWDCCDCRCLLSFKGGLC